MKIGIKVPKNFLNPIFTRTLKSKSLAIASVVGNCVSTYLFTKRAYDFKEKTESLDEKGLAKETFKTFTLPVVIFVGANTCTLLSNVVSEKTIAGLIAANAYTIGKAKEYRKVVDERYGAEVEDDINRVASVGDDARISDLFHDVIAYSTSRAGKIINDLPDGPITLWSQWHKQYFTVTGTDILTAFICAKDSYFMQGFLFLNQLFEYLGIPQLEEYDMIGWDMMDGFDTVDFEVHRLKSEDIYYIYSLNDPDVAIPLDE